MPVSSVLSQWSGTLKYVRLAVLLALIGAPASAQNIPTLYPTDEASVPFLFNGVPSSQLANGAGYSDSISRFPNLDACRRQLEPTEMAAHNPIQIDWKVANTTRDVDVCIFRALTAIRDFNRGRVWLREQGFKVHEAHKYGARLIINGSSSAKWRTYGAEIDKYRFREVFGVHMNLIQFWALRGVSMQVSVDEFGYPKSVQLMLNFE